MSTVLAFISSHRGIVSGIVGGGAYIIASLFSYALVEALQVEDPVTPGAYFLTALTIGVWYILFRVTQKPVAARRHPEPR